MAGILKDREIKKAGYRLIIRTGTVSEKVREAILRGLKEGGEVYYRAVMKNISLTDHTLIELRRLSHPYAVESPGAPVHPDDRMVHEQTGKLKASIRVGRIQETSRKFSLFIMSDSPVMGYLIYGTSRMRPRRFHEKAYEDVKRALWRPLQASLREVRNRIEVTP